MLGTFTAVVTACSIILPGVPVAVLLLRPRGLANAFLSSALCGMLIASLPVWFPPARMIPLTDWTIGLLGLSAASAVWLAFLTARACRRNLTSSPRSLKIKLLYLMPWIVVTCGYLTVLLTRPILEADALNYTLPAAQNYVELNHFSLVFSAKLTIGTNIAVGWPPLLPWLCALGIEIGRVFHQSAEAGIRLIPFVYLLIFWVAAQKVAQAMLPRRLARYAALLTAAFPLLLFNTVAQALYLDIPIAACFMAMIATLLSDRPVMKPFAVGAWAFLVVVTKVTGLPLVIVLAWCFLLYYVGGITARTVMLSSIAALVIVAAKFGLLENFSGVTQWLVLGVITTILWLAIPLERQRLRTDARALLVACVAFSPAIWYFIERIKLSGGLWEYYAPGAAAFHPPNWQWAQRLILGSHLLDTYVPQGVREHLGIGVLLWWGFAPIVMFFAGFGALLAIRKQSRLRLPLSISAMLLIVWLTVFHSQDYRHLLPVLPFEAMFALYAVHHIFAGLRSVSNVVIGCFFLIEIPFAWIALQHYYASPIGEATFNQDAAWTTHTLTLTLLASGLCALAIVSLRFLKQSSLVRFNFRPVLMLGVVSVAMLCCFEPVVATGLGRGFSGSVQELSAQKYFAYRKALEVANDREATGVLGFLTYGIPWFSDSKLRKIDLMDSIDLATLKGDLQSGAVDKLISTMQRLGVSHAVFPAAGSPYYSSYRHFLKNVGLKSVEGLYDPLFSTSQVQGGWDVLRMEPNTSADFPCSAGLLVKQSHGPPQSLEHSTDLPTATKPIITAVLNKCRTTLHSVRVDISYRKGDDGSTGLLKHYSRDFGFLTDSTHYSLPVVIGDAFASGNKPATVLIASIKVSAIGKDNEPRFINWRSPQFVVTLRDNSRDATLVGDAFVSKPAHAIISFISVENKNDDQELRLYPRPLDSTGVLNGAMPLYAKIVTRETSVCAAGAPLLLTLKAAVSASGRLLSANKSFHTRAGDTTVIEINRWLNGATGNHAKAQWIRLSTVSARGLSGCTARETIGVPHVVIVKNGEALSFLPGTQPLNITDVK